MSDKSSAKGRHKSYLLWDAAADFRGLWRSRTSKTNFKTEAKHTPNHSRKCRTNDQNFCSSSSSNFNKPFKYFLPEKISIKNFEKYRIWALRWFSPSTCYDMEQPDSDTNYGASEVRLALKTSQYMWTTFLPDEKYPILTAI